MIMSIHSSECCIFRVLFYSKKSYNNSDSGELIVLLRYLSINPALAQKFGYKSVQEFKDNSQKTFSLVETGIVHKPSTRLLLINVSTPLHGSPYIIPAKQGPTANLVPSSQGTHDGLMPIEDSLLLFNYGSPKEAR